MLRTRWAAIGAAVAVTLGAGGIGLVSATSPSDAVTFVPIEPCRLFDTRPDFQVGARSAPLGPDETFTVQATGDNGECTGIPASATGLGMNVTAVDPSQATVLTIWGSGDRPNASSLNPTPGQPPTPNAVTSGLTGAGELKVWNAFGSVHVLVDIVGYYTDHNHDDRYYTEGEVDTALGTVNSDIDAVEDNVATVASDLNNMTRVHFARVAGDGTVSKTSNQAISVTKGGTGSYTITLPEPAANCTVETGLHAQTDSLLGQILLGLSYSLETFAFSIHRTDGAANQVTVFVRQQDVSAGDQTAVAVDLPFSVTAYCSDPIFVFDPGIIIPPIIIGP